MDGVTEAIMTVPRAEGHPGRWLANTTRAPPRASRNTGFDTRADPSMCDESGSDRSIASALMATAARRFSARKASSTFESSQLERCAPVFRQCVPTRQLLTDTSRSQRVPHVTVGAGPQQVRPTPFSGVDRRTSDHGRHHA